jgi:hypothetical protein
MFVLIELFFGEKCRKNMKMLAYKEISPTSQPANTFGTEKESKFNNLRVYRNTGHFYIYTKQNFLKIPRNWILVGIVLEWTTIKSGKSHLDFC